MRSMIVAERPVLLCRALRIVHVVLRESPSTWACPLSVHTPAVTRACPSSRILEDCRAFISATVGRAVSSHGCSSGNCAGRGKHSAKLSKVIFFSSVMRYDVCRGERPSLVFSGQSIDEGPPRRLVTIVHNRYRWGAFNSAATRARLLLNLSSPWRCDPALPRQTHAARCVQRRFGGSHARSCRFAPRGVRAGLPREVQQNINMESYRLQRTGGNGITLERKGGALEPQRAKSGHGLPPEEIESLSRIIAELNERFGLNLGPEHRVTLGHMMAKLDSDAALDAAARVNTRENVRLTFDHKVDAVIQEIVDTNFDLYKRITDDRGFGDALKTFLFDQYLRGHRNASELITQGETKTLEFKSTLRWNLKEDRKDDKAVTHAVLKTIAAFLNTDGGDLLIGVSDNGSVVGIERDQLENDDKFMLHLAQVVRNGLGDRASTCNRPKNTGCAGQNGLRSKLSKEP